MPRSVTEDRETEWLLLLSVAAVLGSIAVLLAAQGSGVARAPLVLSLVALWFGTNRYNEWYTQDPPRHWFWLSLLLLWLGGSAAAVSVLAFSGVVDMPGFKPVEGVIYISVLVTTCLLTRRIVVNGLVRGRQGHSEKQHQQEGPRAR